VKKTITTSTIIRIVFTCGNSQASTLFCHQEFLYEVVQVRSKKRNENMKKVLEFIIPFEIVSAANKKALNFYVDHSKRILDREAGQKLTRSAMHREEFYPAVNEVLTVKLIRISPGKLDDDNLPFAFKGLRDGIADALWRKNDSDYFIWEYDQDKHINDCKCAIVEIWKEG